MLTTFFDNVMSLVGWLLSLWGLLVTIYFARDVSKKMNRGATLFGAIMMVVGQWFFAAIGGPIILWLIFAISIPRMEQEAPEVAAKSRTGANILEAIEDPCTIPGAGNWLCGENPARFGENGELASGEQTSTAEGVPIESIPTGPQPVLLGDPNTPEGQAALRQCWQVWFASPRVNGASRLMAGLPPENGSQPSDWIPSTAGPGSLEISTPAGVNNNQGVLRHWLLPAPVQLEQDPLKTLHPDDEGTWSIAGTGSWPEACYAMPTPAPLPTTAAPVTPPSVSPPEGLTLYDAAGGSLFVPAGTPLVWCVQDPSVGAWYACAPNQQWFWRP